MIVSGDLVARREEAPLTGEEGLVLAGVPGRETYDPSIRD